MPHARTNGVEIYYETHGAREGRPLVLIMGLGAQLVHWPAPFIDRLVSQGHFVVTLDNRDVGQSTSFAAAGRVDPLELLSGIQKGAPPPIPYSLAQMADDVLGLLDALGLRSVHLAGVSMGGRIAQLVAIAKPERVRSLTSIMSTTGGPDLPRTRADVTAKLFTPPARNPEEARARAVDMHRTICVNERDFDEARFLQKVAEAQARGFDPSNVSRQLAAMLLAGDSELALRQLRIPALVIHGALDPLLPVECGRRTHACLEGSRLWIDEQLGHHLAERVLAPMADAISELTARSDTH